MLDAWYVLEPISKPLGTSYVIVVQVRPTESLICHLSLRLEPLGSRATSDSDISGASVFFKHSFNSKAA